MPSVLVLRIGVIAECFEEADVIFRRLVDLWPLQPRQKIPRLERRKVGVLAHREVRDRGREYPGEDVAVLARLLKTVIERDEAPRGQRLEFFLAETQVVAADGPDL